MKLFRSLMLVGLVVTTASLAQDSRPGESRPASQPVTFDLRPAGSARAILVERTQTMKGKITAKKGATAVIETVDSKTRFRWIDEVAALAEYKDKDKAVEDKRTFLEAQRTENGLVQDPGLEGLTLLITAKGDDTNVKVDGSRRLLNEELRRQLRQAPATGLFLAGKKDVPLGGTYPFESKAFLNTLIDLDGKITGLQGDLTLARVDEPASRAIVTGTLGLSEELAVKGGRLQADYRGTLTIELDTAGGEVVKAAFIGSCKLSGLGELEGSLSGDLDVDVKATGSRAGDVKALKARKPTFRENTHRFAGIEIKLPSCWVKLPSDKPGIQNFLDSRVEPDLVVELARVADKADPSSDEFIASFMTTIRNEDPKAKVVKTSYPAGKGSAFELLKEDGTAIRGCIVPMGDELARLRLVGRLEAVKKADSEFRTIANSLKKAKP
jgi:hypothetical protein